MYVYPVATGMETTPWIRRRGTLCQQWPENRCYLPRCGRSSLCLSFMFPKYCHLLFPCGLGCNCVCLFKPPCSYSFPLWLVSQNLILELVLLGVKISDMIEDICCTWVVDIFKPSDMCFLLYSVLALCGSSINDSGTVVSFKLVFMAILLWLTCLHFDYVKHTFSTVMCFDWSLYEWNLSLVVYFHEIDRLLPCPVLIMDPLGESWIYPLYLMLRTR